MTKKLCFILVLAMMLSVFALPVSVSAASIETPTDVPKIIINTQNSTTPTKEAYTTCSIKIIDEQGGTYETIYDTASSIKIRGNSTSIGEKKPFNIKFSAKQNVLGMGAAKKWALLSNCYEKTLMRNKAVLDFANSNTNLQYTSQSKYADLYLNGKYLGSYQITESVEAGSSRVDIDIDNGDYLMEVESFRTEADLTYIITNRYKNRFSFNEPEVPTSAQNSTLVALFNNAETAMASKKLSEIEKYFDVTTMVDFYIINEFFKSADVYKSSTRLYVKDGKIYGGPLWDFDLASGNINQGFDAGYYNNGRSYENIFAGAEWSGNSFDWFYYLLQCSDFKKLVVERLDDLYEEFENLYKDNALGKNYIDKTLEKYGDHFARNYASTSSGGAGWSLTKMYSTAVEGNPYERNPDSTYSANVEYFRDWLENRHKWLRKEFGLVATPEVKPVGTKIDAKGCTVVFPYGTLSTSGLGANLTDGVYADGTDIENNNWFAFINGENAIPYSGSASGRTKTGVVIIDLGEEYNITGYRVHHLGMHPAGSLLPHSFFLNASNNTDGGYENMSDETYVGTPEANPDANIWQTVTSNAYWSGRYDLNLTGRYVALDARFYDMAYINEIELYGTSTADADNGNTSTPDDENSDTSIPDDENSDTSTPDDENSDTSTPDDENSDTSNPDDENSDTSTPDDGNNDNSNTDDGDNDNSNTDVPSEKIKVGDVNNDGRIDADDYIVLKRIYFGQVKLSSLADSKNALYRCDVNGNDGIDADDYIFLKRAYFGTYKIEQ